MENKKRVYCLYRVSTMGQVEKDDIPMQKQSCQEFAERQGWEISKEFSEKGVSGFKISSKDRDAIQEIQKDAALGKFDILLVFMFDRIGRKEDETPFVVEWFVRNGISVWSVNEGEQRFDNHVDKLMNYIRYWQASGESIKTSVRTKTRLGQIVQEGRFKGGFVPYGYKLEKRGRLNKKNQEVNEIEVCDGEAVVVKKIFDKYLNEGYGSQRICTYLEECGIRNRKGMNFTNTTINHMLKNIMYLGILRSGETQSEVFSDLQIIDVETFQRTQELMLQRSNSFKERCVPLNTKGQSLLSGNVFCGHCGPRLTLTTNGKKYIRQDGEVTITPRIRYVCYNKTRHKELRDGQTGYTSRKLDALIEQILHRIFAQIKEKPQADLIKNQQGNLMSEIKISLKRANTNLAKLENEIADFKNEIIKVIRKESSFSSDILNQLIAETEDKVKTTTQEIARYQSELNSGHEMIASLNKQYTDILTWAEMFTESSMETKKMIVSSLIRTVRVRRDYHIEIDFNIGVEEIMLEDFAFIEETKKELAAV